MSLAATPVVLLHSPEPATMNCRLHSVVAVERAKTVQASRKACWDTESWVAYLVCAQAIWSVPKRSRRRTGRLKRQKG